MSVALPEGHFAGKERIVRRRLHVAAIDAETKLIPAYTIGKRNRETTYQFLTALRNRLAPEHRVQITTDGFHFYRKGVEDVFAGQADFAQMNCRE